MKKLAKCAICERTAHGEDVLSGDRLRRKFICYDHLLVRPDSGAFVPTDAQRQRAKRVPIGAANLLPLRVRR